MKGPGSWQARAICLRFVKKREAIASALRSCRERQNSRTPEVPTLSRSNWLRLISTSFVNATHPWRPTISSHSVSPTHHEECHTPRPGLPRPNRIPAGVKVPCGDPGCDPGKPQAARRDVTRTTSSSWSYGTPNSLSRLLIDSPAQNRWSTSFTRLPPRTKMGDPNDISGSATTSALL